ncbi:hypothetical protein ACIQOV_42700, partial [Kitasatospora sp. NPDC091257]
MTGSAARPPRRSALLRATTAAAVAVPLCTAGWFGWRALDHSGPAGAAAAPATSSPATSPPGSAPAAEPPAPTTAPTATDQPATDQPAAT